MGESFGEGRKISLRGNHQEELEEEHEDDAACHEQPGDLDGRTGRFGASHQRPLSLPDLSSENGLRANGAAYPAR